MKNIEKYINNIQHDFDKIKSVFKEQEEQREEEIYNSYLKQIDMIEDYEYFYQTTGDGEYKDRVDILTEDIIKYREDYKEELNKQLIKNEIL